MLFELLEGELCVVVVRIDTEHLLINGNRLLCLLETLVNVSDAHVAFQVIRLQFDGFFVVLNRLVMLVEVIVD